MELFISHRPQSYLVSSRKFGDHLKVEIYEGDYWPEPNQEAIFYLNGRAVARELVDDYLSLMEEVAADPAALTKRLEARDEYSGPSRTVIPGQGEHPIRSKTNADSAA